MAAIRIIGVPMDLGASRRGVDMGPFALRYTDLRRRLESLGYAVHDAGNTPVPFREDVERTTRTGARFADAVTAVCADVARQTRGALDEGLFPLVLGGDHALAVGSIGGAAAHLASKRARLGVVWMDAHGDLNTPESSPSGNVHGMPLAALLGHGDASLVNIAGVNPALRGDQVALVGVRDLDLPEREHALAWGLRVFTMRALDEGGVRAVMDEAIGVAANGTGGIWVSLDMDCLDPAHAPGVGTAVSGGMTYREAHLAMEMLADSGALIGMDVVEVNPVFDERNRTAEVATELLLSALGKRIL